MPPRKQVPKKGPSHAKMSETKEDFEEELKLMAGQSKDDTWSNWAIQQGIVYGKALSLITLMAVYANVSLLTLSPVYGQIAATRLHERVVWSALFVGWGGNLALRRALPVKTITLLPLVAAYIPLAQFLLFQASESFGAKLGPAITEAFTLFPLAMLSTACLADVLEGADLSRLPKSIAGSAPGLGSYAALKYIENKSMQQLIAQIGKSVFQTRIGLELVLASAYSVLARSKLIVWAIPALLHTAFYNTHLMTPMATNSLNSTLHASGWSLVDRAESTTGYISVLDNHKDGFRAMRCDHSLLGGEWTKFERKIVAEPIYSVFTQLEAVRLVQTPNKVTDNEAKALNIGLGIGTSPSALIAHGIDTTIVEIDPMVYDFAKKYFGLPSNHTAVIQDAISWSQSNKDELHENYDYIIHDVFTGGAEPIPLFTEEFLSGLKHMLKPNGVIAINYAGDFTLPPLGIVMNTIKSVFPSCRIFREGEPPSAETVEEAGRDFDNVIVFCTKTDEKVTFRKPTDADFLGSLSRKAYLFPKHEVDESSFSATAADAGILRVNETEKLVKWHDQSALGHWAVMRTVLPKNVWQQW
ncbi:S-adenosyl-L-methionine-dependent methyltransferase [Annulohypoxylon maeteangense]|uniref:S-adenosyl-L-methionine-dependent methyltransferase n=1 Tax=Annulohypoxylon maeteangense TaxID=1927788 RepID=UPI002008B12C|nr:S-adenosyl-L-methionine-dependent methyltransferase [Annulohypoxylon maeteangense]KAI0888434.1 S-adenosyl-L-methionine-dependent methyltransferase [Annulohypoxylon maeteangense]